MPGTRHAGEDAAMLVVQLDTPQDETSGDFYYRAYAPGVGMSHCDGVYVANAVSIHRLRLELMDEADVLVLNNLCDLDVLPYVLRRKARGLVTVYELADDLDDVPPDSPVGAFYQNPENRLLVKRLARTCDALQFSSNELRRKYGGLNPRCEVFPNQILETPPRRPARTGKREIVVGWGGSLGHLKDVQRIAAPLMRSIAAMEGVRLHLMCAEAIFRLFDALPAAKKKWTPPGGLNDYYRFVDSIDIGLAPIEDTAFNRSRSDVKFLEYAVRGVVPVMQAAGPYPETVKHGETGFLFHTPEEMVRTLELLATDRSTLERIAAGARDYVLRERLQIPHGEDRAKFYRGLLREKGCPAGRGKAVFERLSGCEGAVRKNRHLLLASTRFELLLRGGLLSSDFGEKEKAARYFAEAARLLPDCWMPHLFGAYVLGDALKSLDNALLLNSQSPKAWMLRGDALAGTGDTQQALESYLAAAELCPGYELPYLRAAGVIHKAGMAAEAVSFLRTARDLMLVLEQAKPLERLDSAKRGEAGHAAKI